ncbi:cation:proton antiporter [Elizabethkingia anophelis]|uniref:Na+/H+-exchanging protein (Na+/H+ antiporter) n=1 Tax=Elizabethkingia anophelis NUHP1 TaxID=1338011 RepID=A0A077EBP4_9FLAO|nr:MULTISPECIES: cation:proton antiporter [Elizabethkingia]AIL44892.1 Na+/H+-exchanging protein (Na+/H+ antiporter) [Elizabethkingia anophelis NUHP1]AKH93693.1 sodium/hydrogen exchanger [Elizabethkingia anophelis FMS-007]AMR39912.1 transporter [Elizabethkingia anophelis]AMX46550.1 transporter [Elizabethkingia anophelis]AMX50009.1 transporter [Elizabethkingia anophelis]
MQKYRNIIFYITTIIFFSGLMYWFFIEGKTLEARENIISKTSGGSTWDNFVDSFMVNLHHPLALLLIQIVTIILVARLFGWICMKMKQPSVIGEMIAGIALGPSLLGLYFPEFSAFLFPKESLGNLQFLSQIGLIFFMYIVGMELDLSVLRKKAHDAVVISHASIIIPFALGIGLSYFIYKEFAPDGVQFSSFALFIAIAMSITAFPVLARIVQERNLQKTKLGTIVITCAAADDITAWCILAAVIAIVKAGSFASSIYVIIMAIAYVFLMIKVVRPFLKRIADLQTGKGIMSKSVVAIFFLILIISAYATEVIGIHALFGAFMAGAIMPENTKFRNIFIEKVEDVALVVLLPLFFVFTGLRTEIGLLNHGHLWMTAGLIILVAVIGKFIGSALTAKFLRIGWKDSLTIGALMNTRGLMELIVLNIGYDLGVLSPEIFAMMVIMALFTTFMTGPSLDFINYIFKGKKSENEEDADDSGRKYKVLLSFDGPESGSTLLRLADNFTHKMNGNKSITAMNITPVQELHAFEMQDFENEQFVDVVQTSNELKLQITTLFKASNDAENDLVNITNKGNYDLLLIMLRRSIYEGSLLGRLLGFTTKIINPERLLNTVKGKSYMFNNSPFDDFTLGILDKSNIPVGIMVDKNFENAGKVFVPIFDLNDFYLVEYAKRLINNNDSQIIILDVVGQIRRNTEIRELIRSIEQIAPNHITLYNERTIEKEFLESQDLMLISSKSWRSLIDSKSLWLSDIPSTLIISNP